MIVGLPIPGLVWANPIDAHRVPCYPSTCQKSVLRRTYQNHFDATPQGSERALLTVTRVVKQLLFVGILPDRRGPR